MRRSLLSALFAVLALPAFWASAQNAAQPSAETKPVVVSPVVQPDRTVVFRLWAPLAHQVEITGDFLILPNHSTQGVAMVNNGHGLWSYTSKPLTPDLYSYIFLVDGLRILDPVNGRIRPGQRQQQSAFLVPGPEADYLALKPVPHGEVRIVTFDSAVEGRPMRMHLYLPPGYDAAQQRYPLLVLTHGGGEDEWGWTEIGQANLILDNLIAAGKAKPMIVAMPSLGAANPLVLPDAPKTDAARLVRSLQQEILPYCEQNYRLLPGSANRALGGLGVGRDMLPRLLWPSLDRFDWFGFVSGGADPDVFAAIQDANGQALNKPANAARAHFFLSNGASDSSSATTRFFYDELKKRGYNTTLTLDDGIHEWPSFRRHFAGFAQWLFR